MFLKLFTGETAFFIKFFDHMQFTFEKLPRDAKIMK